MKKIDNRKDILLLLLYSPGSNTIINESIIGRTRLIKMLFLFKNEVWKKFKSNTQLTEENMYSFFPWNYGPFSSEVYDDVTFFSLRGFIEINFTSQEAIVESVEEWNFYQEKYGQEDFEGVKEYQEEEFRLTDKGVDFTKDLYGSLSSNQQEILKEFKSRITLMPLRALLRYVYKQYDDFTSNSVIKNDILGG
ncbi:DUF4065 domain-containing protein [Chitinophaga sancti]|uniref:type II toxin-antitoxin system antitoxin SocA domain-containing protein n=1 Tax=Chitinophaga sancti TaxID=1004 RepID=UPI002A74A439|nr:type II toxin-antitoxin system antitoxin SocA domain-containing protein [Chitinophaga sancti]WPQ64581.1 DUF4065 domain-containing protein [Chitinophaga sancti]